MAPGQVNPGAPHPKPCGMLRAGHGSRALGAGRMGRTPGSAQGGDVQRLDIRTSSRVLEQTAALSRGTRASPAHSTGALARNTSTAMLKGCEF